MVSIASRAHFRQRVVRYSDKYGVTKASIRHRVSRQAIYEWKARYDGSWKSLLNRSHRPHHHPREQSPKEIELILRYWKHNKDDRIVLWAKIRKQGYRHSYKSMLRELRRLQLGIAPIRHGTKPKPYERAAYPGQKVQLDVKYVPGYCVSDGRKYYQYTAIDECTRYVYREMYDEHSTYSSVDFLRKLVETFPFPIREIQTDNGSEWTNALHTNKPEKHRTLFETQLEEWGIRYHRIRVATPRHNGKVERQHRTDEKRFYRHMRMYNLEDGQRQLRAYNRRSNAIPKICLNFESPNEIWARYAGVM